ncbi:hypothetical protein [Arthrobacter sp. UYEF20]|uniref:hypothetical protein n=1 Tax=Arthrobacter sp. UYEF20 TaxID=1756363 RepID=UPI00339936DD
MSQTLVKIAARWLLCLMLAVAAAIRAVGLVNSTIAGPQQPVRDYLGALQKGHGGKALGLLHATVPPGNAAMLDGTALQTATSRIANVKVGDAEERPGNQVMVPMEYTIEGSPLRTEFLLQETGREWLFFNTWPFAPSALPTVDVTVVNAAQATVNGIPVNMPNGRNSFAVFYPGEYEATLVGEHFTAPARRATVSAPDEPVGLNLLTVAAEKLKTDVGTKTREYLDSCAAAASKEQRLQPECPFYHVTNNRVVPGSIKWAVSAYPEISIEPFDGRWVVSPLDGKARVTGSQIDLFTGTVFPLDEELDFSFTTRLDIAPDAIRVTPLLAY